MLKTNQYRTLFFLCALKKNFLVASYTYQYLLTNSASKYCGKPDSEPRPQLLTLAEPEFIPVLVSDLDPDSP